MRELIEAFWPGGLTLVVEHAPSLAWDLGDARGTVAVRMPLHPIALDLLAETGPMAVSSANVTSQPPAVTAQQAYEQLGESVSVYLDGGEVPLGQASTIVDLTAEVPTRAPRGGDQPGGAARGGADRRGPSGRLTWPTGAGVRRPGPQECGE